MSSHCYIMNGIVAQKVVEKNDAKPPVQREKVMSYEEKSVGSTAFFKCEACPYMALAEDDIKFHLFTVHPDLAKSNGLADNIQIPCPGCTSVFDAEETLRTHLRNHHKMGIKDVKKMVKSLVQIALKDAKLKKEDQPRDQPPQPVLQNIADVKMPQVIEIVPDIVNGNSNSLPKGVAYISVDELQQMSTPNFEKVDPKEIIQEASINIVYTNEVSTQYMNVSEAGTSSTSCNVIQVPSVTPDLISSIQPRVAVQSVPNPAIAQPQSLKESKDAVHITPQIPKPGRPSKARKVVKTAEQNEQLIQECGVSGCRTKLRDEEKRAYHRKCHQNGTLQCLDCSKTCTDVENLHNHLWNTHAIDMELPTCEICGFKTYKKYRLYTVHMKCHGTARDYPCTICQKSFKNAAQLSKHKLVHTRQASRHQCSVCQLEFSSARRLRYHTAEVHDKLRPFKCPQCDYTASRRRQLKVHMRSHTGDKPYACDQCSYRCIDHNSMRRHKKLHSKEGVYKCKYCPYTTIQATIFSSHMISSHPNVTSNDVHRCPFCPFKSLSKDKYVVHLTTHSDKEGIPLLIEMTRKTSKPSWTIPSASGQAAAAGEPPPADPAAPTSPKTVNSIPIEVYDCDSLSESMQNYPKSFCTPTSVDNQPSDYSTQGLVTDLSKDDHNSDCLISESSNDTMMERHKYPDRALQSLTYDKTQNIHGYLNPSASIEQSLLPISNVNSLPTSHPPINNSINNTIMNTFPFSGFVPPVPQISVRNNITLRPLDKIPLPMTKVTGPIIKPTQILPVPSSSNSPVNILNESEGAPRKKPKISVKSNLILKGPDQVNMFHSQQKLAFKRLEDNERFGLGSPVTFNNLITTQFMQLPPEPALSESPNNIMPYPQDNMMGDAATTPVDNEMNANSQIFTFNQQMNVNSMTMLPPPQKIQTNDPSYIKLEATIKQNTQSPSLERMCNANLLTSQTISQEYKASPPLEDIHKNMSEIKNEVKSDAYYSMALNSASTNPSMDYLIENLIGEQYPGHMDPLCAVVLPKVSDDQQNDVIEIDDNSEDNKLLPRFDMNFPLESVYLMHNDFHFLEDDMALASEVAVNEINRMVTEVPIINQKENINIGPTELSSNEFANFIQGKKDPMMNTPSPAVKPTTNKINVKNIELMKN